METIDQAGVESKVLKDGCHVILVDCRHRYAALQQLAADVAARWTLSSKL